ncbi:MAG: MFS transporter [Pseudomonadota bacterium]
MSDARLAANKVVFVALIGLSAGLTAFDETSLGVVLPTLREDFQTTPAATHWVVNAYLVVMASLVAACGRLADIVPPERLWRLGIVIFLVTSVAAGFAPTIGWLIAIRAVQGIGSALIFTLSVVLIGRVFADNERGRAFGIFSSLVTVLILIGPIAGGLLTEYLSWRWVFWITVPIALLCLVGLRLPQGTAPYARKPLRLDPAGTLTLTLSVAALSIALMQGPSWGWLSPTIICLIAVAVVAGVCFVVVELKSRAPLIDLTLFRDKAAAVSLMTLAMAQYRRVGTSIYLALFLRDGLGFSPLYAGLALLPAVALLPLSTVLVGRYADRFGARRVMLSGIAAIGISTAWLALGADIPSYWVMLPALLVISCFAPAMFGPSRKAMLHTLPAEQHAQAGGVSVTAQMLGSTLAISIGSVLLSMTGLTWPIFALMAIILAALCFTAYRWLD